MTAAEKKTIKQDHVTVTKDPLNLNWCLYKWTSVDSGEMAMNDKAGDKYAVIRIVKFPLVNSNSR